VHNPIINIITRTANRPKAFDRNVRSVNTQTYDNVNHVVVVDSDDTLSYTEQYNLPTVQVILSEVTKNDTTKHYNPMTGRYTPVNLYFNHVSHMLKNGWVLYIDDDNYLSSPDILQKLVNIINKCDNDTLIFFQMRRENGYTIPEDAVMRTGRMPEIGTIGGCCFTYHTKYKDSASWDTWKCADYRFMSQLHGIIPNKAWYNKVVIDAPVPGECLKLDI